MIKYFDILFVEKYEKIGKTKMFIMVKRVHYSKLFIHDAEFLIVQVVSGMIFYLYMKMFILVF